MLSSVLADPVNLGFCTFIVLFGALAFVGALHQRGLLGRLAAIGPGALTGLGVLGTFVGIFQGLIGFNVADISASVPKLLEGMKTAFATSVVGMSCGLLVKIGGELRPPRAIGHRAGAAEIVASIDGMRSAFLESLDKLRGSLAGDGDGSVVTQLQKLRTTVGDEFQNARADAAVRGQAVLDEMRAISTRLAEDNAKAFIEALQIAIQDFNKKLTEQFGENFKQLNVAVGRLLEWQEQYRVQMDAMALRLDASVVAAERSAEALGAVAMRAEAINRAAAQLTQLLEGYDRSQRDLEARLKAFADMARQAGEAMPKVEARLEALVGQLGAAMEQTAAEAKRLVGEQSARFTELRDGFEALRKTTERAATESDRRVEAALSAMEAGAKRAMEQTAAQLEGVVRDTNNRLAQRMEEASRRTTERLEKQVQDLDEALQDELTRAIEALGGRLSAVTQHFAQDYERLAGRLREIVRVAERT